MTAPGDYGMSTEDLANLINAVNGYIESMKGVYKDVEATAEQYIRANDSESGLIMRNTLFTWTNDFNNIVRNLNALNIKVTDRMHNDMKTSHDAASEAGGPH